MKVRNIIDNGDHFDLKPCPFCGGQNCTVMVIIERGQEVGSFIQCPDCLVEVHQAEACCQEENADAWNKRPE